MQQARGVSLWQRLREIRVRRHGAGEAFGASKLVSESIVAVEGTDQAAGSAAAKFKECSRMARTSFHPK
jgi:hypothetical protein